MQPQIQAGSREGGKTILLVDNSASMTATDTEDDATRLDEAKRRAKERIEALYAGGVFARSPGETMVIAFSNRPEVYSSFTRSKQELLAAIDRIEPTHGTTSIGESLKLARAYTTNVDPDSDRPVGDPGTLEVFTDGRIADIDEQVLRGERMVYHRVGTATADNLAIATISVRRPYDRPGSVEVFASLLNFNLATVGCDVQLSVNGLARAIEEVEIGPAEVDASTGVLNPQRNNVVFTPFEQPRGAVIEVAIVREDDLPADNVAQSVVPPPKKLKVALVDSGSFLLRSVLEGMPLDSPELLTAAMYERLAAAGRLDQYDVIVFDDYAPPPEAMPANRYLIFGATPPVEGFTRFGEGDNQVVLNARAEHPVMRFVNLESLFLGAFSLIQPADDVQVLAEGNRSPVIMAISRGPLQIIYLPFDPLDTNWPFQRSFVTFVFNAVEFLGHVGEGLTIRSLVPGDALATRLPATATDIELIGPDGPPERLEPLDPTMLSWGPIRLAGVYLIGWSAPVAAEPQTRAFAVNIESGAEGRIDAAENIEVGQEKIEGTGRDEMAYTPLWPYAITLCLGLLMFEWWVYHRKTYL